jgi:hypothetical protein
VAETNTIFQPQKKLEASHYRTTCCTTPQTEPNHKLTGTAVSLMACLDLLSFLRLDLMQAVNRIEIDRVSKNPTYYSAASSARILS